MKHILLLMLLFISAPAVYTRSLPTYESLHVLIKSGDFTGLTNALAGIPTLTGLTNPFGWNLLHACAEYTNLRSAKVILRHTPILRNMRNSNDELPLNIAARTGSLELFRLILGKDMQQLRDVGREGWTPLHWAAYTGNIRIVSLILSNAPDTMFYTNRLGETPFHKCVIKGHDDIFEAILVSAGSIARQKSLITARNTKGVTPVYWAARYGRTKQLAKMVQIAPESVGMPSRSLMTPLHKAASFGHLGAVKILLKAGADVNARMNWGSTPLHFASKYCWPEVVGYLISQGANVKARNNNWKTPLHWACFSGDVRVIKILLANGAPINARNRAGKTPLHWARFLGYKDAEKLLLQNGGVE